MFWRKKPHHQNLYQKIINLPEKAMQVGPKYPPVAAGIEFKSLEKILGRQKELLINIDMTTETGEVFQNKYWPAIERYTRMAHLLPASENDHHREVGGLLHHGLEVGLFAMQFGKATLYGKDMGIKKRDARERWLFACFMAGLCHDLGKIEFDIKVTSDNGNVWSPHTMNLVEWAGNNQTKKYFVDWSPNRYKNHDKFPPGLLGKVLTDDDRGYISEFDNNVLKELMQALTSYSGADSPRAWPHNLREMLHKADSRSVQEDNKRSRTPADLGLERGKPLIRLYHDGIRRMIKDGKWQINQPGGAIWVLGLNRDFYLVWPRCGKELYDFLVEEGVKGSPADDRDIAEIMARNELIELATDGSYYWRIRPDNLEGALLKAVRIKATWVPNLVDLLPPGLSGSVQANGEESVWSYLEGGKADMPSETPIHDNPGSGPAAPLQEPSPGRIIGPVGNVYPMQAAEVENPASPGAVKGGRSAAKLLLAGTSVGVLGVLLSLMYLGKHWYGSELSFPYFFWAAWQYSFEESFHLQWAALIAVVILLCSIIFPFVRTEVKRDQEKAQEIRTLSDQEAQETIALAKREAQEIKTLAEQEAQKIRSDADKEVQEIKEIVEQEAKEIKAAAKEHQKEAEEILLQAEAEAFEIMQRGEKDAQITVSNAREQTRELWSWAEARAKDAGVTPEEWQGVKKAREEILNRANQEAAAIIDQARAQVANIEQVPQHQLLGGEALEVLNSELEETSIAAFDQAAGNNRQEKDEQYGPVEIDDQGQEAAQVAGLEGKILGILSEQQEMKKRDLERKVNKSRYEGIWELAINNLLAKGKISYDSDRLTYGDVNMNKYNRLEICH